MEESYNKKSSDHNMNPLQEYRLIPVDLNEYDTGDESRIDLIEIANNIWNHRKIVINFVVLGIILGLLYVLTSPKEYLSYATLMPEYASSENVSGARNLLQQYGNIIGLGSSTYNSSSNAIRVELYPNIVRSLSFQDKLARKNFYFQDADTVASIYEYYTDIKDRGLIGRTFGKIKKYLRTQYEFFKMVIRQTIAT